jgi:hypothetical protein
MNRYFIISIFVVAMLFKYFNIVSIPLILLVIALGALFLLNSKIISLKDPVGHRLSLIGLGTVYILSAMVFVLSGGPAEQILKITTAIFVVCVAGFSIYYFTLKTDERMNIYRKFLWEVYVLSLFNFALQLIYVQKYFFLSGS